MILPDHTQAFARCADACVNASVGELPLAIVRIKATGVRVHLSGNLGFTLPAALDELGTEDDAHRITELNLANCSLTGGLFPQHHRACPRARSWFAHSSHRVVASPVRYASRSRPIVMSGPPLHETIRLLAPLATTLESLNLDGNKLGGTIQSDIAAFTKLKKLNLYNVGLQGARARALNTTSRVPAPSFLIDCEHPRSAADGAWGSFAVDGARSQGQPSHR